MTGYDGPSLLLSSHRVTDFRCRSEEQTQWLRDHALQAGNIGTAITYVVTEPGKNDVVAYYAWAMASIGLKDAPDRLKRGAGGYPQPVVLLARLGVDQNHEGKGLGAGLLQDVMRRLMLLSDEVGCRGLLIHAETNDARNFYQHLVPELMSSPTDPLHLVLLMKDIRKTLAKGN